MSTRPAMVVLDVNETLSDLAPLSDRFGEVGLPGSLAATWFAGLLRDGFALTVAGTAAPFADVAAESLRVLLARQPADRAEDDAVDHVMAGIAALGVHPDVPEGLRALRGLGIRLVTLSNGSAEVADRLLTRAGVRDQVERLLGVEEAGVWKPAAAAYAHALRACEVAAEDAMLVAVHPWDIDGARRAGLSAAWVDRRGGRYPTYFTPPDLVVESLTELAERLR